MWKHRRKKNLYSWNSRQNSLTIFYIFFFCIISSRSFLLFLLLQLFFCFFFLNNNFTTTTFFSSSNRELEKTFFSSLLSFHSSRQNKDSVFFKVGEGRRKKRENVFLGSGRDEKLKEHDINTTQNGWCPQTEKKAGDCKRVSVCVCDCVWRSQKSGCRVVVAEHFGFLVNDQQEKSKRNNSWFQHEN